MTTLAGSGVATVPQRVVSRQKRLLRRAGANLASLVISCRLVDEHGGMARAESLLRQGYGLIAMMNHFSVRDAPQALAVLCRSRVIRRRAFIAPVAIHQFSDYEGTVRFFTTLFGLELCPVVTPYTAGNLYSPEEIRRSYQAYLARTATVLESGGIMLLAPQAHRRSELGEPRGRPLGKLLRQFSPPESAQVALLFIGLGIPGVTDYARDKVGGLNLPLRYEARIGATVTVAEALQNVAHVREIDEWVFEQLRAVVPASYALAPGSPPPPA
jgi:hypothetical protein